MKARWLRTIDNRDLSTQERAYLIELSNTFSRITDYSTRVAQFANVNGTRKAAQRFGMSRGSAYYHLKRAVLRGLSIGIAIYKAQGTIFRPL